MERLPIELVIDILQDAETIPGSHDMRSRAWLSNYSLVSAKWRPYAQKLLFREVVLLGSGKQCKKFWNSVNSSDRAEELWSYVESLRLNMDHQDIYVDIICACKSLRELNIAVFHAAFRQSVVDRLEAAPPITALRIRALTYTPFYQLLKLFPTVKHLHLDLKAMALAAPYHPSVTHAWTLVELRVSCVKRDVNNLLKILLPPESASRGSIRILHLDDPPPTNTLFALMTDIGPHLYSIKLNWLTEADGRWIEECTELRELVLSSLPPPRRIFDVLPPTVEHVTLPYIGVTPTILNQVLDGLRVYHSKHGGDCHAGSRGLRTVTYNLSSTRRPVVAAAESDVHGLRVLCASFNPSIQFDYFDPKYGTHIGENEPLGPTWEGWKFPRDRPLAAQRVLEILPPLVLDDAGEEVRRSRRYLGIGRTVSGFAKTITGRRANTITAH